MTANCILGVDPGLSGACAVLGPEGAVHVFDLPTTSRRVNNKTKRQIEPYQLASWLEIQRPLLKFAIVEQVGAMPGQGVTSSFNFGFTTGVIHGIIAACGIEIRTVSPQVWKRHFRLLGQPKDASRAEASRRLPQFANLWPLMKHDGRAEAALLAIYGATLE
jgi:crossover junction endodeoxyribonuclease RuvC